MPKKMTFEAAMEIAMKVIENLKDRRGIFEIDDEEIENEILDEVAKEILKGCK